MIRLKYCYIFSVSIILFPILSQYSIGIRGVTLGEIVLLLFSLRSFATQKYALRSISSKCLFLFIVWCYLISIVSFLLQQYVALETVTRMIRYLFYFSVILFCSNDFDWEYVQKPYQYICLSIAIYIILQKLAFENFQIVLTNKILPLPWYTAAPSVHEIKELYLKYFFQAKGIFTEQGYVAHYILPCMIFTLYRREKTKIIKFSKLSILFLALWFTRSMQAIAISMGIMGLYLLKNLFSKKADDKKRGFLFILPVILFCFGTLHSFIGRLFYDKLINQMFSGGSTSMRLLRGYVLFYELPFIYKAVGVGVGNLDFFVLRNSIHTFLDVGEITAAYAGYVNGISQALLYGGLLGGILFCVLIINLLRESKEETRMLTIIYFVLSLVEGNVFNGIAIFYLVLIFSGINKNRLNRNEISIKGRN